jgi:uncharacterized protein DUF2510
VTESGGGWYPDPGGVPGRLRWWDGSQWTDQVRDQVDEMSSDGMSPPRNRTPLYLAGGVALIVVLLIGIIVAGNGGGSGNGGPSAGDRDLPTDIPTELPTELPGRPRVTIAPCDTTKPASTAPASPTQAPPPERAPRVSDTDAGISYAGQGEPWRPWDRVWQTPGLQAKFSTGYYIVTQSDTPGGEYYATVLSGTVSALVGDGPPADPRCVAQQLIEEVRGAYYPEPNVNTVFEAQPITVSGHKGYVIRGHLTFDVKGYDAKGEGVAIMVLDVGRPQLAVMYISIPDTVKGFDYVFDQVLGSVRTP